MEREAGDRYAQNGLYPRRRSQPHRKSKLALPSANAKVLCLWSNEPSGAERGAVPMRLPDPTGADMQFTGARRCGKPECEVVIGYVVLGAFQPRANFGGMTKLGNYRCKAHAPIPKAVK